VRSTNPVSGKPLFHLSFKKNTPRLDEKSSLVDIYTEKLPEGGKYFGFENVNILNQI